jgi:CBS domain-containing protein
MTAPVVSVQPETPLKDVARLFVERGISGVPVTDPENRVLGVVSEADFVIKERGKRRRPWRPLAWLVGDARAEAEQAKVKATTAGQAMTRPAVTVHADCPLREAAAIMVDGRINRLPVVDDDVLVGIVTRADLVRAYLRADGELTRVITEDVVRDTMWLEPSEIGVEVRQGIVRLKGTVDRRSTASILEKLASQVDGVMGVENDLAWELDDRDLEAAPERRTPETTAASLTAREHPRDLG